MKLTHGATFSLYADKLLELIFAEDQAALYAESFVVLSKHPYVRHQMQLLQRDIKAHFLSTLELFKMIDLTRGQCSDGLAAAIATDMSSIINISNAIGGTDEQLIQAAEQMQNYLLERYRGLAAIAMQLGLTTERKRIEDVRGAKLIRLELVSASHGTMAYEEALHGQPTNPRRALHPVPWRSFFRVSPR